MAKDKQHKIPNAPNLRFPEFNGEWKETTFGQCCTPMEYGMNAASKEYDGANRYIRITDIDESTSRYRTDDIVSPEGILDEKYEVKPNDILFARTGASTGKTYLYNKEDGRLYYAGFLIRANVKEQYDARFVFQHTKTQRYTKWVSITEMRSGQPGINSQEYTSYKFHIPPLAEQKKIADFLTLIDRRIETQIGAIEKLESLIYRLVDVLLENRKWPKARIGDFMEFYPANSLSWEQLQYESGAIRNLHYGIIHNTSCMELLPETLPFITIGFEPRKYTLCKDGDVALADASENTTDIGKTVELANIGKTPVVCGLHTIHGRDIKGLTVQGFKGFAMNTKYFHSQLQKLAQGSKVFSINTDNVKSCYLYIPSLDEQKYLVSLLRKLEDKLRIERQLFDLYKLQKQYLLSNLFV